MGAFTLASEHRYTVRGTLLCAENVHLGSLSGAK